MVAVVFGLYVALVVLTVVGQLQRRSRDRRCAVLALVFPLAWTLWYYQDGEDHGPRTG